MYTRTILSMIKALLPGVLLALFITPANAQSKKKPTQTGMQPASAQRMQRTTNKDRWAAATRHADRRAANARKQSKGVK